MSMVRPTGTPLGARTVRMEDPRPSQQPPAAPPDALAVIRKPAGLKIEISDDIPLPARNARSPVTRELGALLPMMKVGQSVAVPFANHAAARALTTATAKKTKFEFTCRRIKEDHAEVFRIWRTK